MADQSKRQYFATLQGMELIQALSKREQEYASFLESSGRLRRLRINYQNYYGNDGVHSSLEVTAGGDQGELNLLKVNTHRNLLQHLLVMTTSNRPTIDCRAVNTDAKAYDQAVLSNGLLEYYLREKGVEDTFKKATETALVLEEGFIAFEWDTDLGDELALDPETGKTMKDGDIRATVLTPLQHVINPYANGTNYDWRILKLTANRWDLIAKYPELTNKILALPNRTDSSQFYYLNSGTDLNEDQVDISLFYHSRTAAVPKGRAVLYAAPDVQFYDVALPYKTVPVVRVAPSDQINTPFGYSVASDLSALQQLKDAMNSVLATNNIRFGTQNIVGPKGADITVQQLGRGMTYFEMDPSHIDKLKPLQLTKSAPEAYQFEEHISSEMGILAAVDQVSQGVAPGADMSGSAMALLQSMSVQFNSGLIQSYAQLIERAGLIMVQMLQAYAKTPRVASIVGKNNFDKIKSFTGDDLSLVSRVTCEVGNPISRTLAGRMQMVQDLMQAKLITRADEYFNFLETGRWEPLIDNQARQVQTAQAEREALMDGGEVVALISDDPRVHIPDHLAILNSPEARSNPELVNRVLAHVQEHVNLEASADPRILMILGRPPIPQAPMPGAPGAMPPGGPAMVDGQPPADAAAAGVEQPEMPSLPEPAQPK